MISLKSPASYNDLLEQLNKITFCSSFIFFVFMSLFGYLPVIKISPDLLPATEDQGVLLKWVVSFGLVPVTLASIAFLASFSLEAHNVLAKILGLRLYWDRAITKKALRCSQVERKATRDLVKNFMRDIFYKEVALINQHYVQLFWRYTLSFWAIFEHFFVVLLTIAYLLIFNNDKVDRALFFYLLGLLFLLVFHLFFITLKKSYSQVDQIDKLKLTQYFRGVK